MSLNMEDEKREASLKTAPSQAGQFVKLKKPVFTKTFGQGNPPEGLRIRTQKKTYFFPWYSVFKLSETCDEQNKIADTNMKPYPLLHIDFYSKNKKSFEIINKEKSDVESNS